MMPQTTPLVLSTKSFFSIQSSNRVKQSMELACMRDTVDSTVLVVEGETIKKGIIFTKGTYYHYFSAFGGFTAGRSFHDWAFFTL